MAGSRSVADTVRGRSSRRRAVGLARMGMGIARGLGGRTRREEGSGGEGPKLGVRIELWDHPATPEPDLAAADHFIPRDPSRLFLHDPPPHRLLSPPAPIRGKKRLR